MSTATLYRSDSLDSGSASMCADLDEEHFEAEMDDTDFLSDTDAGFSDSDQLMSSSECLHLETGEKIDEDGRDVEIKYLSVPTREKKAGSGASVSRRSSSRRVTFDPNVLMKQAILEGDYSTLRTLLYQDALEHDEGFRQRELPSTGSENSDGFSDHVLARNVEIAAPRKAPISSSGSSTSLADSGADCDAVDNMSDVPDSPLCRSPRHSGVPRVDVNATDNDGLSLLHLCCFAGAADCVRLLVGRGAEVDAADEAGWTPLHVAAYEGLVDVVQTLAKAGATLEARDEEGNRPEDVATSEHIRKTFHTLKKSDGVHVTSQGIPDKFASEGVVGESVAEGVAESDH